MIYMNVITNTNLYSRMGTETLNKISVSATKLMSYGRH